MDYVTGVLTETTTELDNLDSRLADTRQAMIQATSTLEFLKSDADNRKLQAMEMKDQITQLQEANVEGASNLTQEARDKSMEAKAKVDMVQAKNGLLSNSEIQRKATEALMNNNGKQFQENQKSNQQARGPCSA